MERSWTRLFVVCGLGLAACGGKEGGAYADAASGTPDVCVPTCQGKECGDDGCGGTCGDCPAGQECTSCWHDNEGPVVPTCCPTCETLCAGFECGEAENDCASFCSDYDVTCDCGDCASGQACTEGVCVAQDRLCGEYRVLCGDGFVCYDGQCCQPTCTNKDCGPDGCGGECGLCAVNALCTIDSKCVCIPDCKDKECGDDGCGGTCGECSDGEECDGWHCQEGCGQIEGGFGGNGGLAVWVDGPIAWLATSEPPGLHILDISAPENPVELGFWSGPVDEGCGIQVSKGYAYLCTQSEDGEPWQLALGVVDVVDASSPQLVGKYDFPAWAGSPTSLLVSGGLLFSTLDGWPYDLLVVLDISDPSTPTELGEWLEGGLPCKEGEFRDVAADGNFAFVASSHAYWKGIPYGHSGLCIFDVSDPSTPVLVASVETPGAATDIQVEDGRAFVATDEGLLILDVSDPYNPHPLGSAGLHANTVFVDGNLAFASGYSGPCFCDKYTSSCDNCTPGAIEVVDVSEPEAPLTVAFREIPAQNWAAPFVSGGRAWIPVSTTEEAPSSMLTWDFQPCLCANCPAGNSCSEGQCVPASPMCSDGNFVQWDGCTAGAPSEIQVPPDVGTWEWPFAEPSVAALKDGSLAFAWLELFFGGWGPWSIVTARVFPPGGLPAGDGLEMNVSGFPIAGTVAATDTGFVVTWWGSWTESSGPIVRQFDFAGNGLGEEIHVAPATGLCRPAATGVAGGFVVAWQEGGSLLALRFANDGAQDGGLLELATTGVQKPEDGYLSTDLTQLPGGGFLATWNHESLDGDDDGAVAARIFNADGSPLGPMFRGNVWVEGTQRIPSAASLAGGGFAIVWESEGQDGDGPGVFFRIFDDQGSPLTDDLPAATVSIGDQMSPAIAGLTSGGLVVAWSGAGQDDSTGVFVRRFDEKGMPLDEGSMASAFDYGPFMAGVHPSVDHTGDGGFIVVWQRGCEHEAWNGVHCLGNNVLAQRFDANGQKVYSLVP